MSFLEALENRRSYYGFTAEQPVSEEEIQEIVRRVVKHTPSAFNSQTTRIVVLFQSAHKKFWDMVLTEIRKVTDDDAFAKSSEKIHGAFQSGYATLLFFEDQAIVDHLMQNFPLYAANFPVWAQHTSAMHQLAAWTALEEAGLGASLQHYGELVEPAVKNEWNLPESWKLIAQMPVGKPAAQPGAKEFAPLEERIFIYR